MWKPFLSRPSSRGVRWGAPVAAAAVLIGIGPAVTALHADAHSSLPSRTAAQLLVEVQQAKLQALSGTVVETSDLGLPELPDIGGRGGGGASFSSLISGSHTMRLWYAGPDRMRIALLGQLDESDLVRSGTDLWAWSSSDNTATHWSVPEHASAPTLAAPETPLTPQQAAEAALKAIDPTTQVGTDPTAEVAGRPAYQLDLVPRDSRSRIGSVRIAIDGATHVPTRVQVFARGASSPALQVGFTSFSTATPPASTFSFTPPPGATVKQGSAQSSSPQAGATGAPGTAPQVVGKGWTTVVVADIGKDGSTGLPSALRALPSVSGSWGSGRLLEGALFSAVLTDDGRLAVGAVAPGMLYDALSAGGEQ
jgi:outer membrane lipoprotein-sorting protein